MSRRLPPLVCLLGVALIAPSLSAQPNPWRNATERTAADTAPTPRLKHGTVELQVGIGTDGLTSSVEVRPDNPVAAPPTGTPSDREVLSALPALPQGIPLVYEIVRDDMVIVKTRIAEKVDSPRHFPFLGTAQLHHGHWECSVYYNETTQSIHPFPMKMVKPCVQVVHIDKDYLLQSFGECEGDKCSPSKATQQPYVVEAPDILLIEVVQKTKDGTQSLDRPITGSFIVRPDGTVGLGSWGSVSVTGLTLEQTADAVRLQMMKSKVLTGAKAESIVVIVDVLAYNSKRFYVITDDGSSGEQVHAFPCGGNETVLDVVANVGGNSAKLSNKVWIARPSPRAEQPAQILPVDWTGITQNGVATTNYQILAGDRVYVKSPKAAPAELPLATAPVQGRLSGTWYRETPGCVTACTFKNGELMIVMKANDGGKLAEATLTAEYSIAKDGTVYGVFTGVDVNSKEGEASDLAEVALGLQSLVDQPFAAKFRPVEGGLMLNSVRLVGANEESKESVAMICGKYTFAEKGTIPSPKASSGIRTAGGKCDAIPPGDLGFPRFDSPPGPQFQFQTPPPPYGPLEYRNQALPPPPCAVPNGPPPELQQMMLQTFGQMGAPPQVCLPTPTAYFVPPMPSANASQVPVGTWVREIGPIRYKFDVKENHLVATITYTEEVGGKTITSDHILTADIYPTRNAGEVVGLITGFEVTSPGAAFDSELLKTLPAIQKALCDKPIALTFRVYDDAVMVGNLRLPSITGKQDGIMEVFESMAGRYKVSNPVLKPTSVKQTGLVRPYIEPERIGVDFNFNPPPFSPPPMPQPTPLPSNVPVKKLNPFRNGGNF